MRLSPFFLCHCCVSSHVPVVLCFFSWGQSFRWLIFAVDFATAITGLRQTVAGNPDKMKLLWRIARDLAVWTYGERIRETSDPVQLVRFGLPSP